MPQPFSSFGSIAAVIGVAVPNVGLVMPRHSPFADGFVKLHCGTLSFAIPPLAPLSTHVRFVVVAMRAMGLLIE